ncbi:M48 family metalloprotease [Thalassotalea euphylliae]|uniref:Putative beta-barrel assembly-enhancing protease n=1 Tax=Thalassotalea euphylliae TaxID=1655234 RepID=A0A3E0UEJ7_9GAMM|nr:M48 family metalloprotease [Thalassotalea euphylliae]REL35418.1 M48 family peptidase [Thalassotalea euphylliae]
MFKLKPVLLSIGLCLTIGSSPINAQQDKNELPEIGAAGSSILSIDKERVVGDAMMRHLRATQPILHDPVITEYLNHLGNRLVRNAQDVNYKFKFFVLNNNELNAFAFFGGHVGVHSGLITTADTESELASVLAHEISHVTQRHLARRLEAQSANQPLTLAGMLGGVLLTLVNPTVGIAALSTSVAASQQASLNYTRGNEKEADRVGIALLVNSNFDPMGAPNFFGKMAERFRYKSKPPAMLLTHPLPESRISDARLRAQNYPRTQLPPSLEFELAKARIQARYQGEPKNNITQFQHILKQQQYAIKEAANYGLALSYFANEDYNQAKQLLEQLLANDKRNLFYVDALTDTYLELEDYQSAIDMLAALNLLMPNNQVVALNYANALQKNQQYDQAEQVLQDFLLVKPKHFIAYDLLNEVYRKAKKTALMHTTQAEVYALLGAYPKAIDELQTGYNFAEGKPLIQKRIKARILQFEDQQNKLKRL